MRVGMRALISDIHGNVEALEATLRSISAQGVDEIWCLGDIVGYGPNPKECIDLVRKNCTLCLMGNHDWAVLNSPVGFNSMASRMIYRTKEWLMLDERSGDAERQRWEYLTQLPVRSTYDSFLLVHASPRAELSEYILPTDVDYGRGKLYEIFDMTDLYCLVGHTHMPCCITEHFELITPEGNGYALELGEQKAIVNIGSVGQPRDGDNRASYVTLEAECRVITYHRVPYRYDKTMEKLSALGEDYVPLGDRLELGR